MNQQLSKVTTLNQDSTGVGGMRKDSGRLTGAGESGYTRRTLQVAR